MCSNTAFSVPKAILIFFFFYKYFSSLLFLLLIYFVLGPSACMYNTNRLYLYNDLLVCFSTPIQVLQTQPALKKSFFFFFLSFSVFLHVLCLYIYNPLGDDRPTLKKKLCRIGKRHLLALRCGASGPLKRSSLAWGLVWP